MNPKNKNNNNKKTEKVPSFNMTTNFSNESLIQQNASSHEACHLFDFPLLVKITTILVLSLILLFSLVGNALIIIVVFKRPELKNTINFFIVNMAVCDIVLALTSIPLRINEMATGSFHWNISVTFALIFCKFSVFVERLSVVVSVQSLCWIALDRFMAVVFPMKVRVISSRCRALAITFTWIIGLAVKSLDLSTVELVLTADEPICKKHVDTMTFSLYIACFQIAPLILMTILYCVIARTLKKQNKALRTNEVHQRRRTKTTAIKMSICIIASFYVCVFPQLLWMILLLLGYEESCSFYKGLVLLVYITYHFSAITNFIICVTFVRSYRSGLREVFSSFCGNHCNCLVAGNLETSQQEEITLRSIKIITAWKGIESDISKGLKGSRKSGHFINSEINVWSLTFYPEILHDQLKKYYLCCKSVNASFLSLCTPLIDRKFPESLASSKTIFNCMSYRIHCLWNVSGFEETLESISDCFQCKK